jgi:hypothetical protein
MVFAEILAVALVGVAIAAYFERSFLRAEAAAIKAKALEAEQKFVLALQLRESRIRATVAGSVAKVIAEAKAEAEKLEAEVKADVSKAEGRIQALVAKLEAAIKKVV